MNSKERYDSPVYAYQYEYIKGEKTNNGDIEFYQEKLLPFKNKPVLEIGCGTGRITIPLHKQGVNITGIDLAEEMVFIAKKKSDKENFKIPFLACDAIKFKSKNKFSAIIIPFNTICFMPNSLLPSLLENIDSLLDTNGKVFVDFTRPQSGMYEDSTIDNQTWSDNLFISELNLNVRWKMSSKVLPSSDEVKYTYDWIIANNSIERKTSSTMLFSSYPLEKYNELFKEINYKPTNLITKEFISDGIPSLHYFCSFQKLTTT